MFRTLVLAGLLIVPAALIPAFAQDHSQHGATAMPAAPYAAEMDAGMKKMHDDMAMPMSGDIDVDFAKMMIPHHQGAIDMAQVYLKHGKDPELRKLAEEIVAAQEKEIAFLKGFLTKRGAD